MNATALVNLCLKRKKPKESVRFVTIVQSISPFAPLKSIKTRYLLVRPALEFTLFQQPAAGITTLILRH